MTFAIDKHRVFYYQINSLKVTISILYYEINITNIIYAKTLLAFDTLRKED